MASQPFSVEFKVRDYECDLQAVVNNSTYQNYLEHARHEYLLAKGLNFAKLTAEGIHLVVTRAELDYKKSLVSGDKFIVTVNTERSGRARMAFNQQIIRLADNMVMLNARIIGVALNEKGRPYYPEFLNVLFTDAQS